MSDSYQAIYDAVRSRISGGNISEAVTDVLRGAFDVSHLTQCLYQDASLAIEHFAEAGRQQQRPFMLLRPKIYIDGNRWCALYGDNLQDGVAGFGDTPAKAAQQFDIEWLNAKTPPISDSLRGKVPGEIGVMLDKLTIRKEMI